MCACPRSWVYTGRGRREDLLNAGLKVWTCCPGLGDQNFDFLQNAFLRQSMISSKNMQPTAMATGSEPGSDTKPSNQRARLSERVSVSVVFPVGLLGPPMPIDSFSALPESFSYVS